MNAPVEVDDLDAAYAEIARDPYVFVWAGRQWTLPHLGSLDYRLQMRIEHWNEAGVEEIEDLFSRILGEEQAEVWAGTDVPTPVLMMMFDRWVKYSGAQPGEDSASSDSSESTGVSSRLTSDGSTTSASPRRSTAKRAPRKVASRRGNSST